MIIVRGGTPEQDPGLTILQVFHIITLDQPAR